MQPMSDQQLVVYAMREAQLILSDYTQPGHGNDKQTIVNLMTLLNRRDVVEAVDRLEVISGMRFP